MTTRSTQQKNQKLDPFTRQVAGRADGVHSISSVRCYIVTVCVFQSATFLLQFDSVFPSFYSNHFVRLLLFFPRQSRWMCWDGHLAGSFSYWNVTTPETPLSLIELERRVIMDEVRCESWSIARQLNALYESVGHICGVRVTAIDIGQQRDHLVRPTLLLPLLPTEDDDRQQLLEGLRQQDGLLRQQIRDLIAKLPIRTPADQV